MYTLYFFIMKLELLCSISHIKCWEKVIDYFFKIKYYLKHLTLFFKVKKI